MCKSIEGLPVMNATRPLTINITPKDRAGALIGDPTQCVIARAVRRELGVDKVYVHPSRIFTFHGDHWLRHGTPPALGNDLKRFDNGMDFEMVGEFTLPVLSPAKQPTGQRLGSDVKTRGTRTRRPAQVLAVSRPRA